MFININYSLRLLTRLILLCTVLYIFLFVKNKQYELNESNNNHISDIEVSKNQLSSRNESEIKTIFKHIYKHRLWGIEGEGSGPGSTVNSTTWLRAILRRIIDEYSIESMLDAPCGSFLWMPLLLRNVSADFQRRGKRFRYHGVDAVESLIESVKVKYSNERDWQFSVCDFSVEDLPNGYDLVFSRDALQHLSYEKILDSLRAYSRVQGARYLLVGSYFGNVRNFNITIGGYFTINLINRPFNMTNYIDIYHETKPEYESKILILYDIPNYLSKIDFDLMKANFDLDI